MARVSLRTPFDGQTALEAQGGQKDGSVAADYQVRAAVREISDTSENPAGSL